jgi:hypothetical protein
MAKNKKSKDEELRDDPELWWNPGRAARELDTTKQGLAVARCERRDTPPWHKIGAKVRYRPADVLRWIEEHRVEPRKLKEGGE